MQDMAPMLRQAGRRLEGDTIPPVQRQDRPAKGQHPMGVSQNVCASLGGFGGHLVENLRRPAGVRHAENDQGRLGPRMGSRIRIIDVNAGLA